MRRLSTRVPSSILVSSQVGGASLASCSSTSSSVETATATTSNHHHHNNSSSTSSANIKNPVSTGRGGKLGASVLARMITGNSATAISKMSVDEACNFVAQLQPEAVHMLSGTINDAARSRNSYLTASSTVHSFNNTVNYFGTGGLESTNLKPQLFSSEAQQNVYALVCERILVAHEVSEEDAIARATKVVLGAFPTYQGRIVEDTVSLYLERLASAAAEEAADSLSPLAAEETATILLKIFRFVKGLRVTEEAHVLRSHLLVARAIRLLALPAATAAASANIISNSTRRLQAAQRSNNVEGLGDSQVDISTATGHFVGSTGKTVATLLAEDKKIELEEVVKEAIQVCLLLAKRRKDLAPALLQPLCAVLPAHRWNEGYEILTAAQGAEGSYFNLESSDTLLWLMLRAGQHRRVIAAWGWMKHTTAGSSRTVVSAILVALTREHKKFGEIIQLMQHLAQKGKDPTEEAQIAILRSILRSHDPMSDYAMQLVCFWTPSTGAHAFRVHFLVFQCAAKARNRNVATSALTFLCNGRQLGVSVPVPTKASLATPSSSNNNTADIAAFVGPNEFSAILRHIGNLFTHKVPSATNELETVVSLATRLLETAKKCMTGQATKLASSSTSNSDDVVVGETTMARFQDALRLCGCVLALKSFSIKIEKDSSSEAAHSVSNVLEAKIDKLISGIADLFVNVLPSVTLVGGHAVPTSSDVFNSTICSQFASLPSSYWSEGKASAKELAALIPGASVPTSAEKWYELMASSSSSLGGGEGGGGDAGGEGGGGDGHEEDASSILEELGRE